MGYTLVHHAYCGMSIPLEAGTLEECRERAARRIRWARREEFPVVTLEKGKEWEIEEPDDCLLVPDSCGVLVIAEALEIADSDEPDEWDVWDVDATEVYEDEGE